MNVKLTNRQCLFLAVIAFYFVPLLFFGGYSIRLMSHQTSWTLFSLGLFLISFASLSLIYLLYYWEQSLRGPHQEDDSFHSALTPPVEKAGKITALDPLYLSGSPHFPEPIFSVQEDKQGEGDQKKGSPIVDLERENELLLQLTAKDEMIERLNDEIKKLAQKEDRKDEDLADYKLFSDEQLKQKQLQLTTAQQVINTQKNESEKQLEHIHQLECKIQDLSYEIKTLLKLNDGVEEAKIINKGSQSFEEEAGYEKKEKDKISQVKNDLKTDAAHCLEPNALLKKCVNMAQKLTGTNYYGSEGSRYREFPASYFAIDQKRLFESLRGESGALLVVYSQKEHKLIFANEMTKMLLGWSADKFINDFTKIIEDGIPEWKQTLQNISVTKEAEIRLLAKTNFGREVLLNCHLGVVPSGLFRGFVIGVCVPI